MTDVPFYARNGLVANGSFTANSTQVLLGANVIITPSQATIVSATSNVTINSTGIFIGNSTVNTFISSTFNPGTNVTATFAWTNVHSFSSNVNFTGTINDGTGVVQNQTLTDAATVTWDSANGRIATVTLGGNRAIANIANPKIGTYILHVIQDGTGSRIPSFASMYKWPLGTAPTFSTGAGKRDICSFVYDGTNLYGSFLPDVR